MVNVENSAKNLTASMSGKFPLIIKMNEETKPTHRIAKGRYCDIKILPSNYEPTQLEMNEVLVLILLQRTLAKIVVQPVNVRRKSVSEHNQSFKETFTKDIL